MPASDLKSKDVFAFNTINTISADTDDESVLDAAADLCARYELLFSRTRPDSELVRVNTAAGAPVKVDRELSAFIATALDYCAAVDGLYDITMGSVTRLWDFHEGLIPSAEAIDAGRAHVDYRKVHVDGDTVTLEDPAATIDLGGIAKGYIADRLIDLMRTRGVESGMVNLGGNVAVLGCKPDGSPWTIGLRMPAPTQDAALVTSFATVKVCDASVVTSGIYERAFARDDMLYHHILDPRTGYPAKTDLLGATVVSDESLDGDGFTTALIIMGLDRALAFVESNPRIEAVFVNLAGEVYASSAIGDSIPFEMLIGS